MRTRHAFALTILVLTVLPASWFRGRRRPHAYGKELAHYRADLVERTRRIDTVLSGLADDIDALRRRAMEVDDAMERLQAAEDELDQAADDLRDILAPEELHGLHMEYEANLERALRGIVTVERGCGITRLPHRPPDDEEPQINYRRGHLNLLHARLRMQEIVESMASWEPGKPAEASVAARLRRE